MVDIEELPLVVVSVGTDHHRFDRLVGWMDDWARDHRSVRVIVQRGTARPTTSAESDGLIDHDELCRSFAAAVAVVVHGGPSTVMDARSAGKMPIVVPRDPEHGEHVDDHQVRFARHLARHGLAEVATDRDGLYRHLDAALADPDRYRTAVSELAIPGVVAFGRVVDELIGVETPIDEPWEAP